MMLMTMVMKDDVERGLRWKNHQPGVEWRSVRKRPRVRQNGKRQDMHDSMNSFRIASLGVDHQNFGNPASNLRVFATLPEHFGAIPPFPNPQKS